ncbi:MAG: aminotransferase class V-fold PLP-dependent enzyme [Phycisphaeraceae bacterium]|nr:aminotransferase class V-fold PLP-dependent enzyme [Phycisphaerae bacterium]MBX3392148.1 aminotransferase class V-fold PLP-dependent enzyme [Phycisphaeraceae bacterium]
MTDIHAIRSCFPSLSTGTVFLDNAGGSQVPVGVADAARECLLHGNAQVGGSYGPSLASAGTIRAAHAFVARMSNAASDELAIIGPSNSALSRLLAGAYADTGPRDGRDHLVVCLHGHESNIGPWLALEKRGWTVVPWTDLPVAGEAYARSVTPHLGPRVRLVVFPHVSNILGSVTDARLIADLAHRAGARVVVDGVAFAPHRAVDVRALGADWYGWSTYKVYGPHASVLVGTRDAMVEVVGPNHYFIPDSAWPKKFEIGGVPQESCAAIVGLGGYLRFLADGALAPAGGVKPNSVAWGDAPIDRETITRAFDVMAAMERPLQRRLIEGMRAVPGLRILGPQDDGRDRVPTVSAVIEGRSSRAVATAANALGLGMRHGHFYSHRLVRALLPGGDPEDGVLRISLVHYNTPDEVDAAVTFLDRAARRGVD